MDVRPSDYYFPKIPSKGPKTWEGNNQWEITEKMDGSQLSFMMIDGNVQFFNRGRSLTAPYDEVFRHAVAALGTLEFNPDFVYHGETIRRNRHNQTIYDRVPRFYFVLFDIQQKNGSWLTYKQILAEGARIGLEVVRLLDSGLDNDQRDPMTVANDLIKQIEEGTLISMLGGMPEGVVIKHPHFWNEEKQKHSASKTKVVRKMFKEELNTKSAPNADATAEEILERIASFFPSEPRWHKAIQRLRDRGDLTGDKRVDAAAIVQEIKQDFIEECKDTVMKCLEEEFLPKIVKTQTSGFYQWYHE